MTKTDGWKTASRYCWLGAVAVSAVLMARLVPSEFADNAMFGVGLFGGYIYRHMENQ